MIRLHRLCRPLVFALASSVAAAALAATPAQAVVVDPLGDFLPTYTGPTNGDLDVTAVDAVLTGPDQVLLVGRHAAAIGTTSGAAYVWGIDRGAGTELLTMLNPPTGQGVSFDSVVVLLPDDTGVFIDLVQGGAPQPLDPATIGISGAAISVTITESLMPSQGFDFADYRYNLWPRFAPNGVDPTNNRQISDFAPDASTFAARAPSAVPEPSSLAVLAAGVGALMVAMRRRRRPFALDL